MAYSEEESAVLLAFGERVRHAREALEWSQETLAEQCGLDRTYIGGVERGERNLALLNMNKLSLALGESFSGFFPCRKRKARPRSRKR